MDILGNQTNSIMDLALAMESTMMDIQMVAMESAQPNETAKAKAKVGKIKAFIMKFREVLASWFKKVKEFFTKMLKRSNDNIEDIKKNTSVTPKNTDKSRSDSSDEDHPEPEGFTKPGEIYRNVTAHRQQTVNEILYSTIEYDFTPVEGARFIESILMKIKPKIGANLEQKLTEKHLEKQRKYDEGEMELSNFGEYYEIIGYDLGGQLNLTEILESKFMKEVSKKKVTLDDLIRYHQEATKAMTMLDKTQQIMDSISGELIKYCDAITSNSSVNETQRTAHINVATRLVHEVIGFMNGLQRNGVRYLQDIISTVNQYSQRYKQQSETHVQESSVYESIMNANFV